MTIKRLSVSELSLLAKLFRYNDVDAMIAENSRNIGEGTIDIFCILDDGIPFGELRVRYVSDDTLYAIKGKRAYLYAFRINKEYRGNGYGKQLLRSVIDTLSNEGYTEFTIGVQDNNLRAKHIYSSLGFSEVIAHKFECYNGVEYFYSLYLKT